MVLFGRLSLALESRGLSQAHWEHVLSDVLHSIRSLLCTATNCSLHERLLGYQRHSSSGHSVPSWLSSADRAYLRKHVHQSKFDQLVEEVEVLHANPQYAHIRLPSRVESTVSIRDLAPCGETANYVPSSVNPPKPCELPEATNTPENDYQTGIDQSDLTNGNAVPEQDIVGEHSGRIDNAPESLGGVETAPKVQRSSRITKSPTRLIVEA